MRVTYESRAAGGVWWRCVMWRKKLRGGISRDHGRHGWALMWLHVCNPRTARNCARRARILLVRVRLPGIDHARWPAPLLVSSLEIAATAIVVRLALVLLIVTSAVHAHTASTTSVVRVGTLLVMRLCRLVSVVATAHSWSLGNMGLRRHRNRSLLWRSISKLDSSCTSWGDLTTTDDRLGSCSRRRRRSSRVGHGCSQIRSCCGGGSRLLRVAGVTELDIGCTA